MSDKEFNMLLATENTVLVSITSRNCDPCFLQKAVIEKVQKNIGKRISIVAIDAGDFPELAEQHNALDKPALMLYINGELVWKQKEILSTEKIIEIVLEKTL